MLPRLVLQKRIQSRFFRLAFYLETIAKYCFKKTSSLAKTKWLIWKPRIDKVLQASIAISTATSTFKLSIEIIPIILSMLTVMATAPLLSAFLPAFVFDQTVIFFTVIAIAAIAGYQKFRELVLRAKLDNQININARQAKYFEKKITKLTKRLEKLEKLEKDGSSQYQPLHFQPSTPGFDNVKTNNLTHTTTNKKQVIKTLSSLKPAA